MTPGDEVRVMVSVAVPPALAFEVFTREIDLWWQRGPRFRHFNGDRALIAIEPGVGGRVFEQSNEAGPAHEIGRVLCWDPPSRLVFEWRLSNFSSEERTEVEVLFAEIAPGTQVTVTHRGWAALRGDHPARHGQAAPAFIARHGRWWGDLLMRFRLFCGGHPAGPEWQR